MLKIYVCPECYNFRMVSKKTFAVCLHCTKQLRETRISYEDYTNLTLEERKRLKERMKLQYALH